MAKDVPWWYSLNIYILLTMKQGHVIVRTDYIGETSPKLACKQIPTGLYSRKTYLNKQGMTAWKDWLIFKIYMPDKQYRYGIKAYLISESKSGYMCNVLAYTGKSRPVKNLVLQILGKELLNKGYHLHEDSYYKTVQLSEMLLENHIHLWYTASRQRSSLGNEEKKNMLKNKSLL
jgi:hypothetical protein